MIKIGNKEIGTEPYIIAEAGVNHNGDFNRAVELIVSAAEAGCDAIKFQTYTADELVVKGTPKFWKAESKVDEGLDQYEAYKKIGGTPYDWYPELMKVCRDNNIEFLSTAFSFKAADYLNSIGMAAFKVASSDLSHLPYLKHIARYGKPIILSTGAATMDEVYEAVATIEKEGNKQIIILHCTLCYPTEIRDANLNQITSLETHFEYPIGLSDHTLSENTSLAATAIGATVLEKHFTLDKTLPDSADHWLSLDPQEMARYVKFAYMGKSLAGTFIKKVQPCEVTTRLYDKRSIVSAVDIPHGAVITEEMLTYKRPGSGIWPKDVDKVIGFKALIDIKKDTTITWDHV